MLCYKVDSYSEQVIIVYEIVTKKNNQLFVQTAFIIQPCEREEHLIRPQKTVDFLPRFIIGQS